MESITALACPHRFRMNLSPQLLARLGHLNRSPPAERTGPSDAGKASQRAVTGPATRPVSLDRGREWPSGGGCHWLITTPVEQLWQGSRHWLEAVCGGGGPCEEAHPELQALGTHLPDGLLLLDLETCGLAGSIIFLAGVLWQAGDQLELWQLWARNYAEEKPLLETLWRLMRSRQVLVTFNGKSFDWIQVRDRSTVHRLGGADRLPALHCDLLHHARRQWGSGVPNCRLTTLERFLCGRRRVGDVPGYAIPELYHRYVHTGQTSLVAPILQHNALDLITLWQLSLQLLRR